TTISAYTTKSLKRGMSIRLALMPEIAPKYAIAADCPKKYASVEPNAAPTRPKRGTSKMLTTIQTIAEMLARTSETSGLPRRSVKNVDIGLPSESAKTPTNRIRSAGTIGKNAVPYSNRTTNGAAMKSRPQQTLATKTLCRTQRAVNSAAASRSMLPTSGDV